MAQTETLLHDRTVQSMQDLDRTRRTAWRAFQNGLLNEDEFARVLDQIDTRLYQRRSHVSVGRAPSTQPHTSPPSSLT